MAPAGMPPELIIQSLHNRFPSFRLITRTAKEVQVLSFMLTAWHTCQPCLPTDGLRAPRLYILTNTHDPMLLSAL